MTSAAVIKIDNLSKAFPLYRSPADIVYELFLRRPRHDVFWALRNISLTVNEGDRIGIVGANGAGKSTLLKIITGNLAATSGQVQVNGSLSSMLSLTSFLNDRETGLENIRSNLSLMGVGEREIPHLLEEIIDFTELGSFIHSPVHTYSSGMNARLAFAISTALTPDVLIVDEVLGVGDGYFVGKATERMMELCRRGRALLYVSHSLNTLQMLCTQAIWLDKGVVRMAGPVDHVVKAYEDDFRRQEDSITRSENRRRIQVLQNTPSLDDLDDFGLWRIRIRSSSGKQFRDVHYVAAIEGRIGDREFSVPLDLDEPTDSWLDIMDSEWGRYHEHEGRVCRPLSSTTGRRKGGHVLLRKPATASAGDHVDVTLTITYRSTASLEQLVVECLDETTGKWRTLPERGLVEDGAGWLALTVSGALTVVGADVWGRVRNEVSRAHLPDVIIRDAHVVVDGASSNVVRERQPFHIAVEAEVIRSVPALDIGIRVIRSDGVYTFWQSTGQTSGNVSAGPGLVRATFDFSANLFAGGRYQTTVYAANGWDQERNYPYSEVYDRRISLLNFLVTRENEILDFGAINSRVPTTVTIEQGADVPA